MPYYLADEEGAVAPGSVARVAGSPGAAKPSPKVRACAVPAARGMVEDRMRRSICIGSLYWLDVLDVLNVLDRCIGSIY
jgi:hypothetical protein